MRTTIVFPIKPERKKVLQQGSCVFLHHVRNWFFLKHWSFQARSKHKQHEMYECQVMQMSRRGTPKATQMAWTRPYSLVFLFTSPLLLSKVSFTQLVQKTLPQFWPHWLSVMCGIDFQISVCYCSCFNTKSKPSCDPNKDQKQNVFNLKSSSEVIYIYVQKRTIFA